MTVFDRAHAFVERWEGGFDDDPDDRGGVTNYGVSLRFLRGEHIDVNGDGKIDREDILSVTPEIAKKIFKENFWPIQFERLSDTHPAMATAAYDTAVNMGKGYAFKLVQRAVGTTPDGIWGPKTWAAIKGFPDILGCAAMIEMRKVRYEQIAEKNKLQEKFLHGWLNRANALAKECSKYAH